MPELFQLVGRSGSGKTLAIERATRLLRRRGLRVAVLKHSHHRLDLPGKDTARFRRAGSELVVFSSEQTVLFSDWDPAALARVLPVDVVLIEGFHARRFPGTRLVVRHPREAPSVATAIGRSVRGSRRPRRLVAAGRRTPTGPLWELVSNLMDHAGVRRLELLRTGGRRTARSRRSLPWRLGRRASRSARPARRR